MTDPLKDPTPLQPNYLPENLYNRQEEQKPLENLTSDNSAPQNLFLHGPRGTGKTHVTHFALEKSDRKCYVPCTQHDTQYKALKQILRGLNEEVNDGHHTSDLQRKVVEKTKAVHTVIILDDIDFLLLNDGDDLLYFLTRMETRNSVDLVLISSNHTGLKSQIEERTYSSLQPQRINFEPYTAEETYQILVERARKALVNQSLQKAALTYITSTTQNISVGLHWLKHAAETTDSVITESHVQQVQKKAYEKYAANLLNRFTEHHRLLYQAIRELDVEENTIKTGKIYTRYEELCKAYNENTLSKRRLSDYLKHLELVDLIEAEYHYGGSKGKTRDVNLVTL
ncbi:Cdc6/Cdc18 family protein [Halonotius pteroides]|uniref:Orc1-type DNA replication protein n=1 Tax=Halonotius pteroides TaxID=268735 RepID=A0A3A6QTB8_9EURY|nr:AAA family ATPase [Halonotius pteroides]RJX51889.1 Orc1-type DNA replication protein [Halonotius pteroides]